MRADVDALEEARPLGSQPGDVALPSPLRTPRSTTPLAPPPVSAQIALWQAGDDALERDDWTTARRLWSQAMTHDCASYSLLHHFTCIVADRQLSATQRASATLHLIELDPQLKIALWTDRAAARRFEQACAAAPRHVPLQLLCAAVAFCHRRSAASLGHIVAARQHNEAFARAIAEEDVARVQAALDDDDAWAQLWAAVYDVWPEHLLIRYTTALARGRGPQTSWAEEELRQLAHQAPGSSVALEILAQLVATQHRWEAALHYWRGALLRDSDRGFAWMGVGSVLLRLGEHDAAEAHFAAYVERAGASAQTFLDLAAWLTRGDSPQSERAAQALMTALEHVTPTQARVHQECLESLVEVLFRLGRLDEALVYNERALQLVGERAPDTEALRAARARLLWAAERHDEALLMFEQVYARRAPDAELALEVAERLTEHLQFDTALVWWRRWHQAAPDDVRGLSALGTCLLNLGDAAGALTHLERSYAQRSDGIGICSTLAIARALTGDGQGASALVRPYVAARPDAFVTVYNNFFAGLMRAEHYDAVRRHLSEARSDAPEHTELMLWEARLAERTQNLAASVPWVERILAREPEHERALRLLRALAVLGLAAYDPLRVLRDLRRVVPDDAQLAREHAEAAHAAGLEAEALSASEAAYRLAPNDADIVQVRAAALYDDGQDEQALALMRRAIELDPAGNHRLPFFTRLLLATGDDDALPTLLRVVQLCTPEELEPLSDIIACLNGDDEPPAPSPET